MGGYMPSKCDTLISKKLQTLDVREYKHVRRWLDHMRSFSDDEKSLFREATLLANAECSNIDQKVCLRLLL